MKKFSAILLSLLCVLALFSFTACSENAKTENAETGDTEKAPEAGEYTLGLGVVVSMFTAIVVTKFLLRQLVGTGVSKRSLFYAEKKNQAGGTEA